jgi:hypothetical protein
LHLAELRQVMEDPVKGSPGFIIHRATVRVTIWRAGVLRGRQDDPGIPDSADLFQFAETESGGPEGAGALR